MNDDQMSREQLLEEVRALRRQLAEATGQERRLVDDPLPQELIRLVLDTDPNLIFVKDSKGRFLLANKAMAGLYGTTPEELVREGSRLAGPRELAEYQRVEQKVLQTRMPVTLEEQNTRPDGQVRWFQTTKTPLVLPDGTVHVLGIATDITQRKLMLEALRASEERCRNLIEHAADAVFLWDQHGRLIDANQSACDSLGYSRAELLELSPADLQRLLGLDRTENQEARLKAGEHITLNGTQQGSNGAVFPVEVRLAQSETQGRRFTLGLFRDVTDRKKVEEALRSSNDALQALIHCAPVAIYTLDVTGLVRSWNPTAERMFGWKEEDVLGRPPPQVTPEMEEEVIQLREHVLRGESFAGVETRRQRKDGTSINVSLSASPLRDALGRVCGIMAVAAEIGNPKPVPR